MKRNIYKARSFIAIFTNESEQLKQGTARMISGPDSRSYSYKSNDNKMKIEFILRKDQEGKGTPNMLEECPASLILGDDYELDNDGKNKCMASAVHIEIDIKKNEVKILSSIVGLPPVFIYKENKKLIITSDIYLLSIIPGIRMHLDHEAILDICNIGYPIEFKTIIKDCKMMQGGFKLVANSEGDFHLKKVWSMPESDALPDWSSYTDMQIEAFNQAMNSLDLSNSFLSLTAGLDTRAIFAALTKKKNNIPAFTISSDVVSLDAKTAQMLCNAYGINHSIVNIGSEYCKKLPDYIEEASRLSGGLASIEQATEVFYYEKIGGSFVGRLSGNLGNQVGRGGVEKINMRNVNMFLLNKEIYKKEENTSRDHWYKSANTNSGHLDYEFLLQKEIPFSSVSNYCVGSNYCIQQSPYANQKLINLLHRMPLDKKENKELSLTRMRLKDLRHRFFGEPEQYSFQRKFINKVGGFAATYPINCGWRAKGGISLSGFVIGSLTMIDALAYSKGLDTGIMGKGLRAIHISGLHEFRRYNVWIKSFLKDFMYDTLFSSSIVQSGLFDQNELQKTVKEHYASEKNHNKELILALDLALAHKNFNVSL